MKFLFFFVHPSKYHLFKHTINALIFSGNKVKVLITSKDVLETLVKNENWDYDNIFPEGRKIRGLNPKLSAFINLFRTLYRLNKYASQEKYNLYITDDLLTIIGRLKKVKSILFQDDDITAVPESFLLLGTANYILSPSCTNFKFYNRKKIGFNGFKASAYLHPNIFSVNQGVLSKYNLLNKKFYIIRLVSLTATHDTGKQGLNNEDVASIIKLLETNGEVIISSERAVSKSLEKYRRPIHPIDLVHLIAFADLFISDSQTMSMEAGFLGTPYIRFNDFVGKISYLEELEKNYHLGFGILTKEKSKLLSKISELLYDPNLKHNWLIKRERMLKETIDLTHFMTYLFENYPESIRTTKTSKNKFI